MVLLDKRSEVSGVEAGEDAAELTQGTEQCDHARVAESESGRAPALFAGGHDQGLEEAGGGCRAGCGRVIRAAFPAWPGAGVVWAAIARDSQLPCGPPAQNVRAHGRAVPRHLRGGGFSGALGRWWPGAGSVCGRRWRRSGASCRLPRWCTWMRAGLTSTQAEVGARSGDRAPCSARDSTPGVELEA
jgi:hypothetical protein